MPFLIKKKRTKTIHGRGYLSLQSPGVSRQKNVSYARIGFLLLFFLVFSGLIFFRLVKLQIIDGDYYYALAYDQHELFKQLYPQRGRIYIQQKGLNGQSTLFSAAINRELHLVFAVPKAINDPEAVTEALFEVLDFSDEINKVRQPVNFEPWPELTAEQVEQELERLNKAADDEARDKFKADLLARLSKHDDPYEPIQHRVLDDPLARLAEYNLEGIRWVPEPARYYPEASAGSHVLGFVGHTSENNLLKGYYGVEGNYNQQLAGEAGYIRSELDSAGRWIAMAGKDFKEAVNGSDIVLTIDKAIQYYACEQLFFGVKNFAADSGSIIVMNPQTGAILAMCSYPDFDPNQYNKVNDVGVFNNAALLGAYEPGSIFKAITMAAAIDKGKITPYTTYNDPGEIKIAEYTIRNSDQKAHGVKTMTQVLEESLNTGTIFAARQIGQTAFTEYVKNFGFGSLTGIDLSPEAAGNVSRLDEPYEIYMATASFGQGLTVTPLQMVRAYAAIANDGKLVKPYVVEKIISPDGAEQATQPQIVGQVISPKTAKLVGGMLAAVVENGHANLAKVKNYVVAGKTGTAQVPDLEHGGYGSQTIHSFIGYAPLDNPRFVMLVKLDHVKNTPYSVGSAAPIFGKVAKFILDYYEVQPSIK